MKKVHEFFKRMDNAYKWVLVLLALLIGAMPIIFLVWFVIALINSLINTADWPALLPFAFLAIYLMGCTVFGHYTKDLTDDPE